MCSGVRVIEWFFCVRVSEKLKFPHNSNVRPIVSSLRFSHQKFQLCLPFLFPSVTESSESFPLKNNAYLLRDRHY